VVARGWRASDVIPDALVVTLRNLFDQYESPENRLTHALASCLAEDRRLLRRFVKWATGATIPPHARRLEIVEQQLPGDPEVAEGEAKRKGLPDACIHDGESWCLLIESKVMAGLSTDQLRRHLATLQRRGFGHVQALAIIKRQREAPGVEGIHLKRWTDIYQWSRSLAATSKWARRLAEYLEVAEMRMASEGYLREGTLTTFAGIPFGKDNPYNYPEAKRILAVAMDALRRRGDLRRELRINPRAPGRPAITEGSAVWDVLQFRQAGAGQNFSAFPHLTLGIGREEAGAILVFPHGMKTEFRRRLRRLEFDQFRDVIQAITRRMLRSVGRASGFVPWLEVVQRHYVSRRGLAIIDGRIEADPRTAIPAEGRWHGGEVKFQPQWLEAAFDVLQHRQSNIQLAIGARFYYERCPLVAKPDALDYFAATWIACKPMADLVLGK